MTETVLSLADDGATDATLTGAKAATLATLAAHGFRVPPGVVVTTETYRRVVADDAVRERLDALERVLAAADRDPRAVTGGVPDGREATAGVRDAIRERDLPPDVAEALEAALDDRHAAGDPTADVSTKPGRSKSNGETPTASYAVRSSATAEDLPDASFAGQYETHLGVDAADVPDAVRDCLASLFTDRAVEYRRRAGVDPTDVEMAVVVQTMVEPDVSGVLFTADPLSGVRSVSVVEAGAGRGDAQVSGRTTADTARYDERAGEVTEYRVGDDRPERALDDRDVRALAVLGDRIESLLGAPQDVEWAIRDGDVYVLQSRPITGLYPLPEPQPDDGRVHVYYSFGHRQGMTDAMPPLVADSWRRLTNEVGREYGLPGRFAVVAGGRLFLNLTPYVRWSPLRDRIVDQVRVLDAPAADALDALLDRRPGSFPEERPSIGGVVRGARVVSKMWRLLGPAVTSLPGALRGVDPETTPADLDAHYERAVEDAIDRVRVGHTVADRVRTAYEELESSPRWLVDPFYGPFLAAFVAGRALRRLFPDRVDDVNALALGNPGDPVFEMTRRIGDLADVARETPAVADAVRDGATLEALADVDGSGPFRAAFRAFLDDYGFRAVGEIDWSRPRYREAPEPLLGAVASALADETADAHAHRHGDLQVRAANAHASLLDAASPPLRPVVRRLAAVYRGGLGIRELPKFALARLLDELRTQTLAAGRVLADAGAIDRPEDVWLLSRDELRDGLDDPRTLAGLALDDRRRQFERDQALDPPRVLTSDGEVGRPTRHGRDADAVTGALHGTGAAPGVAEGTARVVTDPSTDRLDPGDVLVAPYTDPGWTPLFTTASAVVTEVGGRLTHGSLVAREYGIPAVVAVPNATKRLKSGDRVRVDGTRGVVERLDDDAGREDAERVDEPVP